MAQEGYEVIVIGGGLLGAAVAAAAAQAGNATLLLEARGKGHSEGSSHGHSRIIRTLSSEAAVFADMARVSFHRMHALNTPSRTIVRKVPAIFITRNSSPAFEALMRADPSAERLAAADLLKRYGLKVNENDVGMVDPTSGVFDPAALLEVLYETIGRHGGTVRFETSVTRWEANGAGIIVHTGKGEARRAKKLVMAGGGWMPELLERGTVDLDVKRRLGAMKLERIPLFYFDYPEAMGPLILVTLFPDSGYPDMYAMPEWAPESGKSASANGKPRYLKVGFHKGTPASRPSEVCRSVQHLEVRYATEYLESLLGRALTLQKTGVCLYALPPDPRRPGDETAYNELPLLGALPKTPGVYLAAYGGGICAKHALALGDALWNLMQGETDPGELDDFNPARLMVS